MEVKVPATAVDIYRSLPEGTRCEVIFNELSMSPAPTTDHQILLMTLSGLLFMHLKRDDRGQALPGPVDVYLENLHSAIQPDLIFILNENKHIIKKDGVYGAPDLAIEILSTNHLHDTVKKKALYQQAGIKEYFIIDQVDKSVSLFVLDQNKEYQLAYTEKGLLKSAVLGCSLQF